MIDDIGRRLQFYEMNTAFIPSLQDVLQTLIIDIGGGSVRYLPIKNGEEGLSNPSTDAPPFLGGLVQRQARKFVDDLLSTLLACSLEPRSKPTLFEGDF